MKLINIKKDDNIKIEKKLAHFIDPDYIYIPYNNEKLSVTQNSNIFKDAQIFVNNNKILSPVSGKVLGISKTKPKTIVIQNDFREKRKNINSCRVKIDIPTILKVLSVNDPELYNLFRGLKSTQNMVINVINDEPYVFNNIILFKENIKELLELIDNLHVLYKCENTYLVVKNIDSDLIDECINTIGTYPNIKLILANDLYLLGKKDYLLKDLKLDLNKTLYLSISELQRLTKLLKYNVMDSTNIITLSGDALESGLVLEVKKYTKLNDILKKYGKFNTADYVIIVNSLLNGYEATHDLIITDDIHAIHIMKKQSIKEDSCIKCGKCIQFCPKNIDIVYYLNKGKKSKECIDCGICNYVCPSYINLRKYLKGDLK